MKMMIKDNERAFLYKHGIFKKMLLPGKQRARDFLGETIQKVTAEGSIDFSDMNIKILCKDPEFGKCIAAIDVPDDKLAIHFKDGRVADVLEPGQYAYWNIFESNTFELVDVADPESAGKLPASHMAHMPSSYFTEINIGDGETGLLFYNGAFRRTLPAGQYFYWTHATQVTALKVSKGRIDFPGMNFSILRKDPEFEKNAAAIEVPDDKLAVRFTDGRIADVLKPGQYVYWNAFESNTFELVDVANPESAGKLPASYMAHMPSSYFTEINVGDGETSLLFYNDAFRRTLSSGRYFYWTHDTQVTALTVDTRVQQLDISGQEILTADKVSLRVNFVCSFQVTDAVSIVSKLKDYRTQIYVFAQLVLREFTGKYRFDDLLRQKDNIGGLVLEKLREREKDFFVTFFDAGMKDIILPGEIRNIMNTVLIAEKSAQASVITRREETAAAKSLLDTAKLMDENATLFKLKELEYLERICGKVGSISVGGGGGIMKSLRELITTVKTLRDADGAANADMLYGDDSEYEEFDPAYDEEFEALEEFDEE
jgi:hypothetical protein